MSNKGLMAWTALISFERQESRIFAELLEAGSMSQFVDSVRSPRRSVEGVLEAGLQRKVVIMVVAMVSSSLCKDRIVSSDI